MREERNKDDIHKSGTGRDMIIILNIRANLETLFFKA